MRWLVTLALCCTVGVGCKKASEESAPPAANRGPETSEEAPAPETNTYVSATPEAPADDADEDDGDGDEAGAAKAPPKGAAAAGIEAKVATIQEARALADEAASTALAGGESLSSPALIRSWPAADHTLVFVYYPLAPSKTGVNSFIVGTPIEVTVNLVDGSAAHTTLKKSTIVREVERTRDPATLRANLEAAEGALVEVILERRPLSKAVVVLDGYREWFNAHRAMMTDLDKRMPEGIRWLKEPKE